MLVGCASGPTLTSDPIEVSTDDLPQYWTLKSQSFSFSSNYIGKIKPRPKGYVKIRYLIDSNGDTSNPKVVESEPSGVWDDQGLLAAKKMQYSPSENNTANIPVYVTSAFYFEKLELE